MHARVRESARSHLMASPLLSPRPMLIATPARAGESKLGDMLPCRQSISDVKVAAYQGFHVYMAD